MAPLAETKKLTFAELASLTVDVLKTHVKSAIKLFEKIDTAKKSERDERKQNAKYVADLRRRYADGKDGGTIPPDWTFPVYSEKIIGVKIPGRLLSLAALFNSLVLMNGADGQPLISETVYDNAALDWLEKANAIVNAAMKKHGENWKSCQDVQECIAALNAPGDAAEKLDKIRKRQKGEADADTVHIAPMTAEMAVEFLTQFLAARAADVAKKPENAKEIFCLQYELAGKLSEVTTKCDEIIEAFGANYDKETLQNWTKAIASGVATHLQVISSHPETQPAAPTPAPAAPAMAEPQAPAETEPSATETPAEAEAPADAELVEA